MDKICHRILSRFVDDFLDKRGNLSRRIGKERLK